MSMDDKKLPSDSTTENSSNAITCEGNDGAEDSNEFEGYQTIPIFCKTGTLPSDWSKIAGGIFNRLSNSRETYIDLRVLSFLSYKVLSKQADMDQFHKLLLDYNFIEVLDQRIKVPIDRSTNLSRLFFLLTTTTNCCDQSAEFCKMTVSKEIHKHIIENLRRNIFSEIEDNKKSDKVLEYLLTVLYNILIRFPDCKQKLREDGVIEVALIHLNSTNPVIKTISLFLISFAADVNANKKLIRATSANIQFILDSCLRPAMAGNRGNGWTVEEILDALSSLSANCENVVEMANLGFLELSEVLLDGKFSEVVVKPTLDIIWSMTFLEDLRKKIGKCDKLISQIEQFKSQENEGITKSASGIEWNLKNLDNAGSSAEENLDTNHIMISYCWEQKQLAWQIKEKLNKAGKTVWIDTKDMQGDVFDAMVDAVDNSSHVICCISEDYTRSRFCRLEATNAWKKKKSVIFVKVQNGYKENGWLEFIMSGAFYYEMHSDLELEKNFARMLASIDNNLYSEEVEAKLSQPVEAKLKIPAAKPYAVKCLDWSKEEVITWFTSIGCSMNQKTEKLLQGMNGEILGEICSWQTTAPEFFLKVAKEELDFDLLSLAKFSKAVAKLTEY